MVFDVASVFDENDFIIIICVAIGIVLLLILYLFLHIFVISKNKIKKTLKATKDDYSYYYSLLVNQDSQYVNKLESIATRNLLYGDIYGQKLDKYIELKGNFEVLDSELNELEIYVEDKNVKAFKSEFKEFNENFTRLKEEVKKLNEELIDVIRPEENCSRDSLILKDKFRETRALYESISSFELEGISDKFNILFNNIEKRFNKFEELVDSASYDEARELLPSLGKVLTEVKAILEVLPIYLHETQNIIPQLAGQINIKYKNFSNSKLPLNHLDIEEKQKYVRDELISLRENFLKLNIKGADEKIKELHEILETLDKDMDKEAKSRNEFNDIHHEAIKNYTSIEKDVVKLNNSIPNFLKYYAIDEINDKKLKELNNDLDTLSKFKRRIDYYIVGVENTYYTDLLNKVNDLNNGIKDLNDKYEAFNEYLKSLKKDVDDAFNVINNRYLQIKKGEAIVRSFIIKDYDDIQKSIKAKYDEGFDRSYTLIDAISSTLKTLPIDVVRINELKVQLNMVSNELLNHIDEDNSFKDMATQNIVYLNRERMKFMDVHNLLSQAESLFFNGEYKSAYDMSETILSRINNKDKVSF